MKNIPLFTTRFGVASLTLEKIPYTGQAYVVLHNAADPVGLLRECTDFCRAAGAEKIYASGDAALTQYPLYTTVIAMSRQLTGLPVTDAVLLPVRREDLPTWRGIYNEKMGTVPTAAYLTIRDSEKLLETGNCYFALKDGKILGIGVAGEGSIKAIASAVPGGGRDTLLALCTALRSVTVGLEVAANNGPALRLYESLGFTQTGEISRWYQIK